MSCENERIRIALPVIVEGKYDKIKLSSIIDANIITTDGFGIFNNREKLALIRRLADKRGVLVVTDSDGAGLVIRNYLRSTLPPELVHHIYIPAVRGKEKRKTAPSKEGLLGVEGTDAGLLRAIFEPWRDGAERTTDARQLTMADFYEAGLSGGEGSAEKRRRLCSRLSLPLNMSAGALLAAVNMLGLGEEALAPEEKDSGV